MRFLSAAILLAGLAVFCNAQRGPPRPTRVRMPWSEATESSVTVTWNRNNVCVTYTVQLLQGFSSNVLSTVEDVTATVLKFEDLKLGLIYGGRVQCVNRNGRRSRFSIPARTKTVRQPGASTTMAPTTAPKPDPPIGDCGPGSFTCGDGFCIPASDWCNTIKDCNDDSDEQNCPGQCETITEFSTHGNFSCSLYNSPTSACFFECDSFFTRVGAYYVVCENETWTLDVPSCSLDAPFVEVSDNGTSRTEIFVNLNNQEGVFRYIATVFRAIGGNHFDPGPLTFALIGGIVRGSFSGLEEGTTYEFKLAAVTIEGDVGFETPRFYYARTAPLPPGRPGRNRG